jgi:hypothetical protein
MLIEQLAGAFAARLLELAFGPRAAEAGAIGGGILFRPLPRYALLELFEIDQVPHAGPRHASPVVIETMQSFDEGGKVRFVCKSGGYAPASSILIIKFPIMQSDRKCRVSRSKYFLLYHGQTPT